jgi:NAD(P)-dependent dehydrogenase (short-subunit alcohol dehydrogenase family)
MIGFDPVFALDGRVAVITGGMGQLGMTYSAALAARGAQVVILDVATAPRAEHHQFRQGLEDQTIVPFEIDITERDAVRAATTQIIERWGPPHILVNNAGLDAPPDAPPEEVGPFEDYPLESFERVMDVNVKGMLICCQVIGDGMARRGRGSIINISSIYGLLSPCQDIYEFRRRHGEAFYKPVAYSVSKSAVFNLTRYLATYWARNGVRVNTLTLGGVLNEQPEEFLRAYCARAPMGRMAKADELAGALVFLASDASSYMTGSNLVVDGGWSAW